MTIINEQRNYREVKESIRIIKGQRSNVLPLHKIKK